MTKKNNYKLSSRKTKKHISYNLNVDWNTGKGTYAELFWNFLRQQKIKKVWGLTGQGISYLINFCPKDIKYLNIYNELQNGYLAQLYGRLTNNVGFTFTTTGPGVANGISALKNAQSERNPFILCSIYTPDKDRFDFQSWDIEAVGKTLGPNVFIDKEDDFINKLADAYFTALYKKTGVLLLINPSLFLKKATGSIKYRIQSVLMDKNSDLDNYANTINNSFNNTRVLVILGKSASTSYELVKFLKNSNVPYVDTVSEKLIIDGTFYCGQIGTLGNHSANYAMYHSTHVIVIGDTAAAMINAVYAPQFNVIFLNNNKKIYNISNDKQIYLPTETKSFVVIDFDKLIKRLNFKPDEEWIKFLTTSNQYLLQKRIAETKYEKFIKIAADIHKEQRLRVPVATDVGNCWIGIGKYFVMKHPNLYEYPCVWDSIGTGIANSVAFYEALHKPVWAFVGDGGLLWGSSSLLYLLDNPHLPITVTIYVNHIYACIETYGIPIKMNPHSEPYKLTRNIAILNMLPNKHIFSEYDAYKKYLSENPVSDKVRFIIINLGDNPIDNSIFEINISPEYIESIKNSDFTKIMNNVEVIKSDTLYF